MELIHQKTDWPQWFAGAAMLAVAGIAGAVSLGMNVKYGWASDPFLGLAYGLGDIAKLTMLVVVSSYLQWTLGWRLVLTGFVVLSLFCAINVILDMRSQDRLDKTARTQSWTGATADLERIRTKLDAITETGDAAALTAQADAAKIRADAAKTVADDEFKTGRGPRWDAANAKWEAAVQVEAGLRGQAGQARQRDALRAELKSAKAALAASGGPAEASVLVGSIASSFEISEQRAASLVDGFAVVLIILASEFATWLAVLGAPLVRDARRPAGGGKARRAARQAPKPEPKAEAKPNAPKRGTRAWFIAELEKLAPTDAGAAEALRAIREDGRGARTAYEQMKAAAAKPAAPRNVEASAESVNEMLAGIARQARKKIEVAA